MTPKKEEADTNTIDAKNDATGKTALTTGNTPSDAGASGRTDIAPAEIAESVEINEEAAPTQEYVPYSQEDVEARDTEKRAPITTLAQLREEKKLEGRAPTTQEREEVEKLERKTMEEGGKRVRLSAWEASQATPNVRKGTRTSKTKRGAKK